MKNGNGNKKAEHYYPRIWIIMVSLEYGCKSEAKDTY